MIKVTFIQKETGLEVKDTLDSQIGYNEVVEHISKKLFDSKVEPEYILLRCKIKLFSTLISYKQAETIKLGDMVINNLYLGQLHFIIGKK